ncbi:leucine-rich repeat protein, partial [Paenibacillus sinopodophylli]|uniref:leucine-rich repeat protein n=1 Tax=Paenibacillus sinopodophylli TaxID=1837342 RepID=UPI00110D1576
MTGKRIKSNIWKWFICLTLFTGLWSGAIVQEAVAAVSGDYTYTALSGGKAAINSYNGSSKVIVIPSSLDGNTVTRIDVDAFRERGLTSVTMPNTLVEIGNNTFTDNNLTTLIIPDSVTTIGSYAFARNNISSVYISESLNSLGMAAFEDNLLSSLTLPNSLSSIGSYSFKNNQLTSVSLPNNVSIILSNAFENNLLTNIVLPSSVTNIGNSAFGNNQLTNLTIPSGVTSIGQNAFESNQLTSVSISSTVTSIGNSAFYNNKLTNLTIPSGVTSIGQNAFESNQLTSVILPLSLTTIDHSAFRNNKLTTITIPSNVTSIGDDTFANNLLKNIKIPSGMVTIGNSAFQNNQLTSVIVEGNSTVIKSNAFGSNSITALFGYEPSTLLNYSITSGQPFQNILSAGVTFSPNGSMFGESLHTFVIIGAPIPSGHPVTQRYRWSTSDVQPAWTGEQASWTSFVSGAAVSVPSAAGPQYLFVRVDDGTNNAGYARSAPFQVKEKYTVTFNSQGGSAVASIADVEDGLTIAAPTAPTRSGYTFAGWYRDAGYATAWNFSTSTVTADTTLYAKWNVILKYTVAFNSQGGSAVASLIDVVEGSTIAAPTAPTRSGYTFAGWYGDAGYATAWNFSTSTVTANTTLYAKWNAIPKYTVTFNSQGGSAVTSIANVETGLTIAAPTAPTRSGYTFAGWYRDASYATAWNFSTSTVTADTTLYAKWNAIPKYTVTFNSQGGSAV